MKMGMHQCVIVPTGRKPLSVFDFLSPMKEIEIGVLAFVNFVLFQKLKKK